jgi:hypothetical protein
MSSSKITVETTAKNKLGLLVKQIDQVVQTSISDMSSEEVNYIISNYAKHLKYDLSRDFEEARTKNLTESPFDAIINDDLGLNNGS